MCKSVRVQKGVCVCLRVCVCKSSFVQKCLSVNGFVCKSVSV